MSEQPSNIDATRAAEAAAGGGGDQVKKSSTVLGSLTEGASNAGRMVAGQVSAPVESALKSLHFSEYKSAVLAEFFGSFILACTVSLAQTGAGQLSPLAVGFMYASLIFTYGYISGAHLNPAVTLGVWLSRDGPQNLSWHKAVLYWIFQLLGSTLAAFYCMIVHGTDFSVPTTPDTFYPGIFRVLITECVFTFMLVSVMLHCATSKQKENSFYGFAVGMAVMAATLSNNGGVLNPAIATSLIVVKCFTGTCIPVLHLWVFWAGELVGCIFAAIFYNVASATLEAEEQGNNNQQQEQDGNNNANNNNNNNANNNNNQRNDALRHGDAPQEVQMQEQESSQFHPVNKPSASPAVQQQQQQQQQNQQPQGYSSSSSGTLAPPPTNPGTQIYNNNSNSSSNQQQQQQQFGDFQQGENTANHNPYRQPAPQQQQQPNNNSSASSSGGGVSSEPSSAGMHLAHPAPRGEHKGEDVSPLYE